MARLACCGPSPRILSESRMREIRLSGSMKREVETEQGRIFWHRQPKGPANPHGLPKPPRYLSTLLVFCVSWVKLIREVVSLRQLCLPHSFFGAAFVPGMGKGAVSGNV